MQVAIEQSCNFATPSSNIVGERRAPFIRYNDELEEDIQLGVPSDLLEKQIDNMANAMMQPVKVLEVD